MKDLKRTGRHLGDKFRAQQSFQFSFAPTYLKILPSFYSCLSMSEVSGKLISLSVDCNLLEDSALQQSKVFAFNNLGVDNVAIIKQS